MLSRLLPALQTHLTAATAHLHLVSSEKNREGQEITRPPRIFIGDFPAKREGGKDAREFPCVLLAPFTGFGDDDGDFVDIAALIAVYNPESGDGEALEMDLAVAQNTVLGALIRCKTEPLERRFTLVPDEKGRFYHWQRTGDPNQPRPYAQITLVSRWQIPGWK